jgi:hypothetical protein
MSGAWVSLAWIVSILRLRLAVTHHEVFDFETSLAFLVVVLMPIPYATRIAAAVRAGQSALERIRTARRSEQARPASARPPPPTRDRFGRRLQ